MLGLGNSITSISTSPPALVLKDLVGWWDFTDTEEMFTDAGSAKVASNDDKIYRINKVEYF